MKKIISLFAGILLMMSFCLTVSAAGSSTISGNASVTVGRNIELTVNVTGCGEATSIAVDVTYGDGFELVSGTWLKTGSVSKFDAATNKGALGGLSSPDVNGNLFKLVLKAKTVSVNAQNVSVNVIAKNGSSEIMNVTSSKSVKINCATHSYSAWLKNSETNHIHTCSTCGNTETQNHTWNSGEVTKQATCKEAGEKKLTCTACNATKTEVIAKTSNHKFGYWSVTKKATCTDKGEQTRSCSVCSHKETKAIDALGHAFSKAVVTKEPTCTEKGTQSGTCTRCNKKATSTIKAKGHKLGEYAVTLEPTCIAEGKEEATCTVCGAKSERAVAVVDHSYGEAVITKEATATETGVSTKTCTVCGYILDEEIPLTSELTEEDNSDDAEVDVNDDVMEDESDSDALIWIVVVLAVLAVIFFILLKKQKKQKSNNFIK